MSALAGDNEKIISQLERALFPDGKGCESILDRW